MASVIQPSFAKGELGGDLHGRVDTAAYQVGIKEGTNMQIHTQGGASNRPGLKFIAPCKSHTNSPVLINFEFKATDTYIIELGNLYARFIRNDAQILEATKNITAITRANPAVVTAGTHGYSNGDHVFIEGIAGMTELNGRFFQVANKTSTTFELTDVYDGGASNIDSTNYTAYSSGGTSGKVYEVATPYAQADLDQLKWTQSADVLTITHPSYAPRELTRTDHNAWTITQPSFAPSIADPTGVSVTVNGADNNVFWKYKVTAIKEETFEESLAGIDNSGKTIIGTTAANPVNVNINSHDLLTGDEVEINGLTEMTELNDRRFIITKVDANNFTLNNEDGSSYDAETTGGSNKCHATFDGAGTAASPTGTTIPNNTITWSAVSGAIKYRVYRAKGGSGVFAFLAETQDLTYSDNTAMLLETDLDVTPPTARNPFRVAGEFPSAVGYYQQRRVFGGSSNLPDTSDFSQTGNQNNFSKSSPSQADDAIRATLNGREVNQVRHYVPSNDLIVLTDGAEWRIHFSDSSGFSAETLQQDPQTSWGSNHLRPIVINDVTLFMQENSIAVRSLGYELRADGYRGTDLNVLAPHIFEDTTGVSWAYSRAPDPVVHVVRSDGSAAALTFDQEQEVLAWTQWQTRNGLFKWCGATRPSANDVEDAAYFVVERVINGNTVLLIERIASRRFTKVEDCFFVDSGLSLDTPVTVTNATAADPVVVTTSSAHGFSDGDEVDFEDIEWTPQFDSVQNETNPDQLNNRRYFVADSTSNTLTLFSNENPIFVTGITAANPGVVTAPTHGLSNGDLIALHGVAGMTEANDNIYKVANKTADTFELNTAADAAVNTSGFTAYTNGGAVYHAVDGSAFESYVRNGTVRKAVLSISGLNHLEGQSVIALADGNVVTNKTVSNGAITLDRKASRVHVGLQIVSTLETLDLASPSGNTIQSLKKKMSYVTVKFNKSRGLLIGPDTSKLIEMKQRENEKMGEPTTLLSGKKEIHLEPHWNSNGRIVLRQVNPLPMTILAIVPDVELGD